MVDLVQWLNAQLDTDAEKARTAQAERDGAWRYVETPGGDHRVLDSLGYSVVEDSPVESEPWFTLPHVAAWNPARVLRETDGKRQALALHRPEPGQHPDFCGYDKHELPCRPLRLLALPYADRDGYQESWRP